MKYNLNNMKNKTSFYSGILGGGIIITIFLILILSINLFNYRIQITKVNVNTASLVDSMNPHDAKQLAELESHYKQQLLNELNDEKLILSPQEYTNNVVNYYNNFLMVLSVMLAGLSFLGFVYVKSLSKDMINERLESDEFHEEVKSRLVGEAEQRFQYVLNEQKEEIKDLNNNLANLAREIEFIRDNPDQGEDSRELDLG